MSISPLRERETWNQEASAGKTLQGTILIIPSGSFVHPQPPIGDRKSLSLAKKHPKTSQEFSEQFGPPTHKLKGFFSKTSHQKVHPNFAKILARQILGNTLSGPNPSLLILLSEPGSERKVLTKET